MTGPLPVTSATRFDVLDALRGICAILVALYHFSSNGSIHKLALVQNGWMFVDYFFVLSGFVIAHSYGARLGSGAVSIGRFMGLRIGRIVPLHLVVLAGFVALELAMLIFSDTLAPYVSREPFTGSRTPESLWLNIFLLQSFGIPAGEGWNVPAWSIAAEMWTYLLFAFVFLAGKRVMLGLAAVLGLASMVWLMLIAPDLDNTFSGGFLRCVFGFSLGVLCYHAYRRYGGIGGTGWEVAVILGASAFVCFAEGIVTFAAPFVFAASIFVLASQRGAVARVLHMPAFQLLGTISYSLYMVHFFLQGRFGEVLEVTGLATVEVSEQGRTLLRGTPLTSDVLTLAMLALLIVVSYISYRLVEKPGRDLSRKLLSGSRGGGAGGATRPVVP